MYLTLMLVLRLRMCIFWFFSMKFHSVSLSTRFHACICQERDKTSNCETIEWKKKKQKSVDICAMNFCIKAERSSVEMSQAKKKYLKRINCEFGAEKENEGETSTVLWFTVLKCCFLLLSVKTTDFIGLSALMTSQELRHTHTETRTQREGAKI